MKQSERVLVVATDLGAMSDQAILEGLTQLGSGAASVVHVVNVIDPAEFIDQSDKPALTREDDALARGPLELAARVRLVATLNGVTYDPSRVKAHARLGKPVNVLLQFCTDYEADVLVVGTHGRQGLDRLLIGSVAEELVRKARCPVLVLRAVDYEGLTKTQVPDAAYAPGSAPVHPYPSVAPERTVSTTSESWEPAGNAPTGFRIV
jgi:nucleotide-binding universal stress UspA family protein